MLWRCLPSLSLIDQEREPKDSMCGLRFIQANHPNRCVFTNVQHFVRKTNVHRDAMVLAA